MFTCFVKGFRSLKKCEQSLNNQIPETIQSIFHKSCEFKFQNYSNIKKFCKQNFQYLKLFSFHPLHTTIVLFLFRIPVSYHLSFHNIVDLDFSDLNKQKLFILFIFICPSISFLHGLDSLPPSRLRIFIGEKKKTFLWDSIVKTIHSTFTFYESFHFFCLSFMFMLHHKMMWCLHLIAVILAEFTDSTYVIFMWLISLFMNIKKFLRLNSQKFSKTFFSDLHIF